MPETPFNIDLSVPDVGSKYPSDRASYPRSALYGVTPAVTPAVPDPVACIAMLDPEKYILLTTFKRDGTPVPTPVWVVPLDDGQLGLWTSSGSGKAKRLAHTSRVTIQACDARGRPRPGTMPSKPRLGSATARSTRPFTP